MSLNLPSQFRNPQVAEWTGPGEQAGICDAIADPTLDPTGTFGQGLGSLLACPGDVCWWFYGQRPYPAWADQLRFAISDVEYDGTLHFEPGQPAFQIDSLEINGTFTVDRIDPASPPTFYGPFGHFSGVWTAAGTDHPWTANLALMLICGIPGFNWPLIRLYQTLSGDAPYFDVYFFQQSPANRYRRFFNEMIVLDPDTQYRGFNGQLDIFNDAQPGCHHMQDDL